MKKLLFAVMALLPTLALANPGPYIQVQAGDTDAIGLGAGLNIGYLWGENSFNYGLELSSFTYADIFGSGYNIGLQGVIRYIFSNGFVTFAKAGITAGNYVDDGILGSQAKENIIAPEFTLGMGYQFNSHWEVDLAGSYMGPIKPISHANSILETPPGAVSLLLVLTYHFA